MAQVVFIIPDDVQVHKALHALAKAAGCMNPTTITASHVDVGAPHIRDVDPGSLLVIVNGAINPHRDLAPIDYAPCCLDPAHGDVPVFAYGFDYLDLNLQDIKRALDDGLWDVWLPDAIDKIRALQGPVAA